MSRARRPTAVQLSSRAKCTRQTGAQRPRDRACAISSSACASPIVVAGRPQRAARAVAGDRAKCRNACDDRAPPRRRTLRSARSRCLRDGCRARRCRRRCNRPAALPAARSQPAARAGRAPATRTASTRTLRQQLVRPKHHGQRRVGTGHDNPLEAGEHGQRILVRVRAGRPTAAPAMPSTPLASPSRGPGHRPQRRARLEHLVDPLLAAE